jgi:hypothetical protein
MPALGAIAGVERIDDSASVRWKNANNKIGDPIDNDWWLHRTARVKGPRYFTGAGLDRQQVVARGDVDPQGRIERGGRPLNRPPQYTGSRER